MMNVPNIDQGPASVRTLAQAVGVGAPPSAEQAVAPTRHASEPSISLTRLAVFDVDGDGFIDPRPVGSGGDATLLVPTHQVDLPTYGRAAHARPGARPARSAPPADENSQPPTGVNTVHTNRAVAAYQRYGQASAPDSSPAPTPVAVPVAVPVGAAPVAAPTNTPSASPDLTPNTVPAPTR
jgi:hypothetical protein